MFTLQVKVIQVQLFAYMWPVFDSLNSTILFYSNPHPGHFHMWSYIGYISDISQCPLGLIGHVLLTLKHTLTETQQMSQFSAGGGETWQDLYFRKHSVLRAKSRHWILGCAKKKKMEVSKKL